MASVNGKSARWARAELGVSREQALARQRQSMKDKRVKTIS
jgi:hypothetical protein